jgi:hypothetical protein
MAWQVSSSVFDSCEVVVHDTKIDWRLERKANKGISVPSVLFNVFYCSKPG